MSFDGTRGTIREHGGGCGRGVARRLRDVGAPWALRAGLLVPLLVTAGCYAAPRRFLGPGDAPGVSASAQAHPGQSAVDSSDDGWKADGRVDPGSALASGRRVVITEFDVEFVNWQFQLPTPRQVIIKPLPISPSPVHWALSLIGIGRRYSSMGRDDQGALAANVYNAFVRDLRGRGVVVVQQEALKACPEYASLSKSERTGSSLLMLLNPLGSDCGTVKHTRTVAAPGLFVITAMGRARARAERKILEETGADTALAVRLRVGTFREEPALEHRSLVRLTTRDGSTTLRANRSLVSEGAVVVSPGFRPVIGRVEPIDSGSFSDALAAMVPAFVDPALTRTKR